jgi:RNA polymerase sigma-70 factor (ECF subfamily)
MQRFEQLYAQHADAISTYVRRRAPEDAVDDVVSDVFLVCWRRLDDVPENALPWLYAVARNTLANERRRRGRQHHVSVDVAYEPEPVGDSALAAAFAELSDRDREVLRLVA